MVGGLWFDTAIGGCLWAKRTMDSPVLGGLKVRAHEGYAISEERWT